MSERKTFKIYFSHDVYARQDPKIKKLLAHFRKESEEKAKAALCVYWWIVEDMHAEDYEVCNLEAYADDYRCDINFLKSILEDFELFRQEDGCYISDRVIRNFQAQEEQSKANKKAADKRWENYRKRKAEAQEEQPIEVNEELVVFVIQEFNKKFKKSYAVSDDNRNKISLISQKNKLSFEHWRKIIENAYRGWDYRDEKGNKIRHEKPNLKRIIEDWESFLQGDAYLAPDHEAEQKEKDEQERKKQEEQEQQRIQSKKDDEEYKNKKNSLQSKEEAIEFFIARNHYVMPNYIARSSLFKELSEKFDITVEEILAARGGEDE